MSRRAVLASLGAAATLAVGALGGRRRAPATSTTATTLPLPSGADTLGSGTFQLFAQSDLNFQTLFGLGEAGLNSVCGEVTAVVAAANAASGGASYQSVFDELVARPTGLQESALEAREGAAPRDRAVAVHPCRQVLRAGALLGAGDVHSGCRSRRVHHDGRELRGRHEAAHAASRADRDPLRDVDVPRMVPQAGGRRRPSADRSS